MEKRYYLLLFTCKNIICNQKIRLEDMHFDFMGRGHCPKCNKLDFEIFKLKLRSKHDHNGEFLSKDKIAMIQTVKIIRSKNREDNKKEKEIEIDRLNSNPFYYL